MGTGFWSLGTKDQKGKGEECREKGREKEHVPSIGCTKKCTWVIHKAGVRCDKRMGFRP